MLLPIRFTFLRDSTLFRLVVPLSFALVMHMGNKRQEEEKVGRSVAKDLNGSVYVFLWAFGDAYLFSLYVSWGFLQADEFGYIPMGEEGCLALFQDSN